MVSLEADLAPAQVAALHAGLAHPARVAILRALRERRRATPTALRETLAAQGIGLDATGIRFHLRRMEAAGIVDVGRAEVALLRDVRIQLR